MKNHVPQPIVVALVPILTVSIIFTFRYILDETFGSLAAFHPFLFAVLISAWLAGPLAGMTAVVLGCSLGIYFFSEPRNSFALSDAGSAMVACTYTFLGSLSVLLIATLRKYQYRAEKNLEKMSELLQKEQIANARLTETTSALESANSSINDILMRLRDNEMIYRAIGDSINYGIWVCDKEGRNIYASDSFLELVGLTQKECAELNWSSILHPDDAPRTGQAWKECVANEGFWDVEYRFLGIDGNWHPVLVRGVPVRDANGSIIYWAGINLDISRQKQTEDDLRTAKEAADTANAAKSSFLANMSHEIRTPLGAILGFSDLLVMPDQTLADRQEYVKIIKRNGLLLSSLINDILDLSKVEAGRLIIESELTRLASILDEVCSGLNLQANAKGITLIVDQIGSLPELIKTDSIRLKQILINIIGNAIKFTEHGEVKVTVKMVDLPGQNHPFVEFLVTDTGIGLSHEESQHLFEPFSQADVSMTRRFGGTGLGLSLSRHLAQILGGNVEIIRSIPGQGSTFAITIDPGTPQSTRQAAMVGDEISTEYATAPSVINKRLSLGGLNILLVDDAPDNQILIAKYLKTAGALVDSATNGREAITKANTCFYDIILMDVQMPIMDGFQATQELRRHGYIRPIVALTAHAMKEDRRRCLEMGFDEHISKPIHYAALVQSLTRFSKTPPISEKTF